MTIFSIAPIAANIKTKVERWDTRIIKPIIASINNINVRWMVVGNKSVESVSCETSRFSIELISKPPKRFR